MFHAKIVCNLRLPAWVQFPKHELGNEKNEHKLVFSLLYVWPSLRSGWKDCLSEKWKISQTKCLCFASFKILNISLQRKLLSKVNESNLCSSLNNCNKNRIKNQKIIFSLLLSVETATRAWWDPSAISPLPKLSHRGIQTEATCAQSRTCAFFFSFLSSKKDVSEVFELKNRGQLKLLHIKWQRTRSVDQPFRPWAWMRRANQSLREIISQKPNSAWEKIFFVRGSEISEFYRTPFDFRCFK